jgi:hypothetical protein
MANPDDAPPRARSTHGDSPWNQVADGAERLEAARPEADRVTFGRLLEHGPAKHMFRQSAEVSYFVRIETLQGERIFRSPALRTAMARSQSQPQVGDEVGVRENSIQPVTLITSVHDQRGNVIGKRRYDTPLSIGSLKSGHSSRSVCWLPRRCEMSTFIRAKRSKVFPTCNQPT